MDSLLSSHLLQINRQILEVLFRSPVPQELITSPYRYSPTPAYLIIPGVDALDHVMAGAAFSPVGYDFHFNTPASR